jgi:hypothetical protein
MRLSLLNVSYNIYEKHWNGFSVRDAYKQGQVADYASGSLFHNADDCKKVLAYLDTYYTVYTAEYFLVASLREF